MKNWIKGIISAVSGAVGTSLTTMIVDPITFNFSDGFGKVLIVAGVSAAIAVFNYLAKSPLPDEENKI